MKNLDFKSCFHIYRGESVNTVTDNVVVDLDDGGGIINIEVYGYSHLAGRAPNEAELEWIKSKNNDAFFSDEDDVLSIVVGFGENSGQKTVMAEFGFDEEGGLVSMSIDPSG